MNLQVEFRVQGLGAPGLQALMKISFYPKAPPQRVLGLLGEGFGFGDEGSGPHYKGPGALG